MIFTAEQINEIKRRLAEEGIKDSDLPSADKIEGDELCAIVQGGINKKMPLWKLFNSPAFETYYQLLQNTITDRMNQLEGLIEQVKRENLSVSDEFGDSDTITISQKTLTDAINEIWSKLEDITGEVYQGINMVVTPTFFVSEDGCDIHIAANTVQANGIFEKIQFFVDGEVIYEAENVSSVQPFIHHLAIKETYNYEIMCKAKILGVEYTCQQIITRYNEFYIGAGSNYAELLNPAHASEYAKKLHGRMRHDYYVDFEDNQKLIIVIGASMRDAFIRADLNGAEIEMNEVKLDAEGHVISDEDTTTEVKYIGFMSEPWNEGRYNIDING